MKVKIIHITMIANNTVLTIRNLQTQQILQRFRRLLAGLKVTRVSWVHL